MPLSNPIFRKISRIAGEQGVRAFVVGGYVRDHYLRRPSTDIDVVVVGSGIALAEALGRELHTKVSVFKTFGTAMLRAGGIEVEFARSLTRTIRASRRSRPGRWKTTSAAVTLRSMRWRGRSMPIRSASW